MSALAKFLNEEEARTLDEVVKNASLPFLPKAPREAVTMKLKRYVQMSSHKGMDLIDYRRTNFICGRQSASCFLILSKHCL